MHRKILIVSAWCCAAALCLSCGIFTPREAEAPLDVPRNDPLNLREILENGTPETFSKLAYEDMFNDAFRFIDSYGNGYGKSSVVARLYSVVQTYGDVTSSWRPDSTVQQTPSLDKEDTVTLYRVYEVSSSRLPSALQGSARITVLYEDLKNTWTIYAWKDNPSSEPGFFNPLFVDSAGGSP